MKTHIKILFIGILLVLLNTSSVSAATLKSGELVVLPKDRVVSDDYFAAGESVTVAGTVAGDAYIAGGMVNVEGTVKGDLLVAGGTVTIRGTVEQDVRAAGGEIVISGVVNGNVTVAGGSVTITDGAKISGNLVSGAGNLNIYSPIAKDITVGAGQLTIGNTVAGNVVAGVGELTLTPNAQVGGDLTYYSEEPVTLSAGAEVAGKVSHKQIQNKGYEKEKETAKNAARGFGMTAKILNVISAFIIGFLALRFFPQYVSSIEDRVRNNPWMSMGIGLLALIVAPIIAIILLATVVGIPIALLVFFGYFFSIYISKIFISLVIGKTVLGYFKAKYPPVAVLGIGLISYMALTSIPVLGGLVVFVSTIIGIGAIVLGKKDYYKMLSAKKVI